MRQYIWRNIFNFKSSQSFAWWAVIIVVVISLLDLLGWFFNITLLKSILVSWSPMKMITACCFLASTGSLAIAIIFQNRSPLRFLSSALSILVLIAGAVTLVAFWADTRLGPKTVVYHSQILNFLLNFENRMAMISAILFILIGIILGLISLNIEKSKEYAQILVIPVIFAGYVVPVRYIIEIHDLNTLLNIPMAFNTAVSFCLLGLAVFCFYPETRLMRVFTGKYAGSTMARRQLFGLLIIPIVIGWLRLTSERINLLSSDMGVAFVAVAYTFFLIGIVWMSARSVNVTDMHRRESEERIRENEQRLKYHFENSPLAIVEWDESFIVTLWSNEAERMFGWHACETLGQRIDSLNLIIEEDIPAVDKTMQRLLSGKEYTVVSTNRNYTKSREIIECIWNNSVLMDKDGHMTSVISLVQDVTEQRKAEEQLKKYAEDLKELNATKDKFFGIIAHDLRNPFTSILGASEVLTANAEEFDLETIKKFSMLLHNAGKAGYAMLENLLEWSRSQTGRLSYVPRKLNVSEVIQQDLDNLTLIAAQKEITLQMSVPNDLFMEADLNMTHTILRNLLNNALKFTHRKGSVNIFATNIEADVIITIRDNGIGISEEDQKKLFRMDVKYTQIGTAEERGTGLGLLLCKEFVEKQGGKIWVESIEGEGSSFKFTLPLFLPVHSQAFSDVNALPPED